MVFGEWMSLVDVMNMCVCLSTDLSVDHLIHPFQSNPTQSNSLIHAFFGMGNLRFGKHPKALEQKSSKPSGVSTQELRPGPADL